MIDRRDFASVTTAAQAGALQSFWPIIIQTSGISFTPKLKSTLTLATQSGCRQFSISNKQESRATPAGSPRRLSVRPLLCARFDRRRKRDEIPVVGANLCDVYHNGVLVQSAPVFSIRINRPNNPWLLFGLSTQIGTPLRSRTPRTSRSVKADVCDRSLDRSPGYG